jgi:hypothetical protein
MAARKLERVVAAWRRCALPLAVANWLSTLQGSQSSGYLRRAARFVAFADGSHEQHEQLLRDWATIGRSAMQRDGGESSELLVFMGLPDRVAYNAFGAIYAGRQVTADAIKRERKHYSDLSGHVEAVLRALEGDGPGTALSGSTPKWAGLRLLLQDALATQEARPALGAGRLAGDLRNMHLDPLIDGLRVLQRLLAVVGPQDKVLTDQPGSDAAAQTVFAAVVAQLNRHLERPQHAALARLAQVNCPEARVTSEQLRKQWKKTDKNC